MGARERTIIVCVIIAHVVIATAMLCSIKYIHDKSTVANNSVYHKPIEPHNVVQYNQYKTRR